MWYTSMYYAYSNVNGLFTLGIGDAGSLSEQRVELVTFAGLAIQLASEIPYLQSLYLLPYDGVAGRWPCPASFCLDVLGLALTPARQVLYLLSHFSSANALLCI